jgi:HrpA-like RNA helicase
MDHGKKMALLPVDHVYAHLLLQSSNFGCAKNMLSVVAMQSAENVLHRPRGSGGGGFMDSSNTNQNGGTNMSHSQKVVILLVRRVTYR